MAQANEARQAEATRQCPRCHGSRIDPYPALEGFANQPCKYCDGHGTVPVPNVFEDLARIKKRDRIVAAIVLQARMQPQFTWTQIADFVATLDEHKRTAFALGIGEKRAPSGETWTMVVAVLRSWAASDAAVRS